MARKTPEVPALTSTLALLQLVADPAMLAAALPLVRERLALTPEKLALMLCRILNPDEIIGQGEEAQLRGVRNETLKKHKDGKELPILINGSNHVPVMVRQW